MFLCCSIFYKVNSGSDLKFTVIQMYKMLLLSILVTMQTHNAIFEMEFEEPFVNECSSHTSPLSCQAVNDVNDRHLASL